MAYLSNDSSPSYFDELKALNVPFYNTTESLTLRLYDYSNVFLLPTICVMGLINGAINIFIIAKTGIKENVHLYMLIGAVSDTSFLLTQVFIALFRCGTLCPFGYRYGAKVYEVYIYLYIGYTIVTFSALVDISVSIDRIKLFSSNSKIITRTQFAIRCVFLFILAALMMMPTYALAKVIVPIGVLVHWHDSGNSTYETYEILYTKTVRPECKQPGVKTLLSVISVLKGPALIATLLVVDLLVVYKFNQHLKKKKLISKTAQSGKEKKENREANRTTCMIIYISLFYFFGNLLDSLNSVIELFGVDEYNQIPMYVIMGNVFLFGSHGLYILIYYNFDKEYNRLFQRLILRRTRMQKMVGTEATMSTNNPTSARIKGAD